MVRGRATCPNTTRRFMLQKGVLLELVQKHFGHLEKIRGIEIGLLKGDLDGHLLTNIPNLEMWTIDPEPDKVEVFKTVQGRDVLNRLHIIELRSDDAIKALEPNTFDFVWVDGDHSYEQCLKDIINYLPLIKNPGVCGGHDISGIIGGHNINPTVENQGAHPGVRQAVLEVFGGKPSEDGTIDTSRITLGEDFTWWVYV